MVELQQAHVRSWGLPVCDVFGPMRTREEAERGGESLVKMLGTRSLIELRGVSAQDIVAHLGGDYYLRYALWPNVDGWVLPEQPPRVFARGAEGGELLMLGTTADEGTRIFPETTPEVFSLQSLRRYGTDGERFLSFYPHNTRREVIDRRDGAWVMSGLPAISFKPS